MEVKRLGAAVTVISFIFFAHNCVCAVTTNANCGELWKDLKNTPISVKNCTIKIGVGALLGAHAVWGPLENVCTRIQK